MYDPTVGRFLNLDPIGFEAGDPNRERYVENAPTNATDPSGLVDGVDIKFEMWMRARQGSIRRPPSPLPPRKSQTTSSGGNVALPIDDGWARGLWTTVVPPGEKWALLASVRVFDKQNSQQLPAGANPRRVGGNEGWAGIVRAGEFVGPFGTGPCVGVILAPSQGSGMPTYVFHFSSRADVAQGFAELNAPLKGTGYSAFVCGNEPMRNDPLGDLQRLHTLTDVMGWLREHGYNVQGYMPAAQMYVDDQGNVYWDSPPGGIYLQDLEPPSFYLNEWLGQFID